MPFSPHHLPHPPSSSPIIIPLPPDATRRLSLPILHSENEWDADTEETKDRIRSQKTFERRVNLGPSIPNWHQLLDDLKKLRDHAVFLMVKERILKDAYADNPSANLAQRHQTYKTELQTFLGSEELREYGKADFVNTANAAAAHIVSLRLFRFGLRVEGHDGVTEDAVQGHLQNLYEITGVGDPGWEEESLA